MTRYSVKRGRRIKKYKKSPKGRGKGRRSISRCKTRKPKGFKKAKRHTVGKRRRMVGGAPFNFNVNSDDLEKYMSYMDKYRSELIINGIKKEDDKTAGFDKVILVAYGFALVTKMGTMFSSKNREEQINVFACYCKIHRAGREPICYAIVRCPKSNCLDISEINTLNSNMDGRILFLFVDTRADSHVTKLGIKKVGSNDYNAFKFTTRLSSDDDTYKILVSLNEISLTAFFNTVAGGTFYLPNTDFNYEVNLLTESSKKPRLNLISLDPGGGMGWTTLAESL
jgi:hypothetical protein